MFLAAVDVSKVQCRSYSAARLEFQPKLNVSGGGGCPPRSHSVGLILRSCWGRDKCLPSNVMGTSVR